MEGLLCLEHNDVDFRYGAVHYQLRAPGHVEVHGALDLAEFFSRGGHHVLVAVDCAGASGHGNPHCGPVIRHGENLFSTARGFLILADGTVVVEFWNGTFNPGLHVIPNTSGAVFDPVQGGLLNIRLLQGYAAGGVSVEIRTGMGGQVVFSGELPTVPQPWLGSTRIAIGGIAPGFVPPAETGCAEQLLPRSAPNARVGYSLTLQLG